MAEQHSHTGSAAAFPQPAQAPDHAEFGLTKREYVAIKIMAGFAANPDKDFYPKAAADESVKWADALFDALGNSFDPDKWRDEELLLLLEKKGYSKHEAWRIVMRSDVVTW
jgi:hypothetical protein